MKFLLSTHRSRRIAFSILIVLLVSGAAGAVDKIIHFDHKPPQEPGIAPKDSGKIVRGETPANPAPAPGKPILTIGPAHDAPPAGGSAPQDNHPVKASDALTVDDADFYTKENVLAREEALLQRLSRIADLKKKITESEEGPSSIPSPSVIVAPPANMSPQSGIPGAPPIGSVSSISVSSSNAESSTASLRLASVISIGNNYQAVIYDHGVETTVREGLTLTDGWRVDKIAPSTAVLVRGRSRKILHVSGG